MPQALHDIHGCALWDFDVAGSVRSHQGRTETIVNLNWMDPVLGTAFDWNWFAAIKSHLELMQ